MKAQKLPSGSYRVQFTLDGKRLSVTAPTEDEAIFEAMSYKTRRASLQDGSLTFGQCLEDYIKSKENILSPKTILVYRQIQRISLDSISSLPISKIDNQTVQVLVNKLALQKSAKTVHNAYSLLISVMSVYCPDKRIRVTLPKVQKKIKQLPTIQELMSAIVGSNIELPCMLALWLGCRLSEILGAKKSDITNVVVHLPDKDETVKALHIHNTIITVGGKQVEKDSTKTKESTRIIPVSDYILRLINKLPEDQEYLVNVRGQTIYKNFKRILKENNLPDMTFHDLRHMNASVMLALGVPDKYAMERGGWSSDKIMKNVYQHTFTTERKAVDDMVDNYFNSFIAHENAHDK